jgi:hypothetical protein
LIELFADSDIGPEHTFLPPEKGWYVLSSIRYEVYRSMHHRSFTLGSLAPPSATC